MGGARTTPTPGQPLGMSDFFVLEAGEYLERLDALVQPAEGLGQTTEEFVRLARALRGAALMGNQQAIARSASGLETLARAVKEGRRPWDQNIRQIAIRAVDDLKIFVRRASSWTEADTAKAEALGAQLEQLAGRPSTPQRAVEPPGPRPGAPGGATVAGSVVALPGWPGRRGAAPLAVRPRRGPARGAPRRAGRPPRHAGARGAGQSRRAPAPVGGFDRARAQHHATRAARPHAGGHVPAPRRRGPWPAGPRGSPPRAPPPGGWRAKRAPPAPPRDRGRAAARRRIARPVSGGRRGPAGGQARPDHGDACGRRRGGRAGRGSRPRGADRADPVIGPCTGSDPAPRTPHRFA